MALMRKVSKDFFSVIMSSGLVAALPPTFFEAFYSAIALTESEVGVGKVATTTKESLCFSSSRSFLSRASLFVKRSCMEVGSAHNVNIGT